MSAPTWMQSARSLLGAARSRATEVVNLFATPLEASHYVELVNPLWSSHKLQARVEAVWDETSDARTITLRPGRNWRSHRAGQHVRVGGLTGPPVGSEPDAWTSVGIHPA